MRHCQRKEFVYPIVRTPVEAAEKDLETRPGSIKKIVWMRYETTVQTLCYRQRELEQTELGCWDISVTKRHKSTQTTQSCRNSGVNNIVPTHSRLLSRDNA